MPSEHERFRTKALPLLNRDQEVVLGKRMEAGRLAADALKQVNGNAEERLRLEGVIEDGKDARETLWLSNFGLVVTIAKRYSEPNLEIHDLIQQGNIGLGIALDKYDHRKENKFATFAYWWIHQTIDRHVIVESTDGIVHQWSMRFKMRLMHRTFHRLTQELKREPTVEEIAKELKMTSSEISDLVDAGRRTVSIEAHEEGEGLGDDRYDVLEDRDSESLPEAADSVLLNEQLTTAFQTLSPFEQELVRLRYGLYGSEEHTNVEIAKMHGYSRGAIRAILKKARMKLKNWSKGKLSEFA